MYKIFIVDDEYRVKERIMSLTEWEDSPYIFCGEASDGEMALSLIQQTKPHIVLMDIEMPFMSGIEVATILRTTMPWVRIVLLSGYNEFSYAQEAVKLGISDYLLKPIRFKKLKEALDKVVADIEKEQEAYRHHMKLEESLQSVEHIKKDALFEALICGRADSSEVIRTFLTYHIDMVSNFYVVIDVKIISEEGIDFAQVQQFCLQQLDKLINALWYYHLEDRLIVLLKGSNYEELKERAFGVAEVIRDALCFESAPQVAIGIGNVVDRIGRIPNSFRHANKACSYLGHFLLGQIVFYEDIDTQLLEHIEEKRLHHLKVGRLGLDEIDEYIHSVLRLNDNSPSLISYARIMNIIFECVEIVAGLGGVPKEVLPEVKEQQLIELATVKSDELTTILTQFLQQTIGFKQNNGGEKYGVTIGDAKAYIQEHYTEPNLSLHMVAEHVYMSPNHFSTIFSNETNRTFIEYLTHMRLKKAEELLRTTEMKLADIAYAIGYNEPQYFSFIFKKHRGISPSIYRKEFLP